MIIIVEGADGSGKTTLVNKLREKGFNYIPAIPREYPSQYEMYKTMFKSLQSDCKNFVFDRGLISELVYRCVKEDAHSNISLKEISDILDEHCIKIVYCKNAKSYEHAKKRGETYVTSRKEHRKICNMYDAVMKIIELFTLSIVIKYDWENESFKDLLEVLQ